MFEKVQDPITLATALVKDTVSLGEPILLEYRITNNSATEIHARIGLDGDEWCAIVVRSEAGDPVARRVFLKTDDRIPPDMLVVRHGPDTEVITVCPDEPVARCLVLGWWFELTQPGLYEIHLDIHLHYGHKSWSREFSGSQTHLLELRPLDERTLAETMHSLTGRLEGSGRDEEEWLLRAILSLPEWKAEPLWREWLSQPKSEPYVGGFIEKLASLGTSTAVALLSEIACGSLGAQSLRARDAASRALRDLAACALPLKQRLVRDYPAR